MSEGLRPCPFCGGAVDSNLSAFGTVFRCEACGLHAYFQQIRMTGGRGRQLMNVSDEEAPRRWNRRAEG